MKNKVVIGFLLCQVLFSVCVLYSEGFVAGTLVTMQQCLMPIEAVVCGQMDIDGSSIAYVKNELIDSCVKIKVNDNYIIAALDQKFYVLDMRDWVAAKNLKQSNMLLCRNGNTVEISNVEIVYEQQRMYIFSVEPSHIFYITTDEIIVHNMELLSATTGLVIMSIGCPAAGAVWTAAEALMFGIAGIGTYWAYKNHKKQKKIVESIRENNKVNSCGGSGKDPKNENDDEDECFFGVYKDAPYHHMHSAGDKGPSPRDGNTLFKKSLRVSATERIAIEGDFFAVFRETQKGEFHGYLSNWKGISGKAQKVLIKNGLVRVGGKIIRGMWK